MTILQSYNPADNTLIGEVEISTEEEIKQKVSQANSSKSEWKELGITKRVALLENLYKAFLEKKDEIVKLAVLEMGKPVHESISNFEGGMAYFKWYLDNAEKYLKEEVIYEDEDKIHYVLHEPIGTAAVIAPWNYPFSNFIWGVIPNLIIGNTVVFKHSEECPLSGKLYEEIIESVNLPKGVFSEVYGDGKVGQLLVEQKIDLIWFTGSTNVGKKLYQVAAQKFIKIVLELGGSAPGVVFNDVEIDKVVERIYAERFSNCGQSCDALKRLIVHEDIVEEVTTKLKKIIETKKVANPSDESTDIGPLVAKRQVEVLQEQIKDATDKGAEVIIGGNAKDNCFFELTLLKNITPEMKVWKEEVFGPVLPIVTFKTEEESIKLANDTTFGLGAYVFTKDKERIERLIPRLETGMINMNGTNYVVPSNPFGGYKQSGLGREHGKYGLHELSQLKLVAKPKN